MKFKRISVWLCALFVFIPVFPLRAQEPYNVSRFTRETGDFLTAPINWRGKDWLRLGMIVGGAVLVMRVDEPIRTSVLDGGQKYYRSVPIEAGRIWGEWYTPPIIAGAFGLHGWLADKPSSRKIAFELVQAVTYAEAITQLTKFALGRARPYENEGAFSYHPFNIKGVGFQSLPGGHNTEGWAMSTVLARNSRSNVVKVLVFVPSVLTFVSRIYQDKHWTSDDLSGALVGIVVGSWVVNHHAANSSPVSVSSVAPLTITFTF